MSSPASKPYHSTWSSQPTCGTLLGVPSASPAVSILTVPLLPAGSPPEPPWPLPPPPWPLPVPCPALPEPVPVPPWPWLPGRWRPGPGRCCRARTRRCRGPGRGRGPAPGWRPCPSPGPCPCPCPCSCPCPWPGPGAGPGSSRRPDPDRAPCRCLPEPRQRRWSGRPVRGLPPPSLPRLRARANASPHTSEFKPPVGPDITARPPTSGIRTSWCGHVHSTNSPAGGYGGLSHGEGV